MGALDVGAAVPDAPPARRRRDGGAVWRGVFVYVLLTTGASIMLLPFVWMVSSSLKREYQVFTLPPQWVPQPVRWINYYHTLVVLPFLHYFANTLTVVGLTALGDVITCTLTAYAFARLEAPGKDVLFILLLSTLMLPYAVTLIPVFALFDKLGLVNTYYPLWLPHFFAVSAFLIFLERQFFMGIPKELEDAAAIDGAGHLRILFIIIVPNALPAIIAVLIFSIQGSWNDFLNPLIYLSSNRLYTLAVGLYFFIGRHHAYWNYLMAGTTMMIVPLLVLFYFGQRLFVRGITLTGIKG